MMTSKLPCHHNGKQICLWPYISISSLTISHLLRVRITHAHALSHIHIHSVSPFRSVATPKAFYISKLFGVDLYTLPVPHTSPHSALWPTNAPFHHTPHCPQSPLMWETSWKALEDSQYGRRWQNPLVVTWRASGWL